MAKSGKIKDRTFKKEVTNLLWEKCKPYCVTFVKWTALAVLCGVVIGPIGSLFALALETVTNLRTAHPWLIWLLPLAGLPVVLAYRKANLPDGSTNAVFIALRNGRLMPLVTAPLIFCSTVITHLFGGSAGREGAALQLGGSITGKLGQAMKLSDIDCRGMTMCGMAAAFAAVFGTPLAAAIFTLEVANVGVMHYAALVPCVIAALIGFWIAGLFGIPPERFTLPEVPELTPIAMLQTLILAAAMAVVSIVVCLVLHSAPHIYQRYIKNPYLRVVAGGVLIAALTALLGTTDYNGAGAAVLHHAIEGHAVWYACALKLLFTALTLGAGYKGGEIVPVFFIGATFGCAVGPLMGLPAGFAAGLGMGALFCACTNCPLASIFIAIELFGGQGIPLFALACTAAYTLSGYFGLYSEQKILYDKLRSEYIDRKLG